SVERILPGQEHVSDDITEVLRLESLDVLIDRNDAARDRNVDRILRDARRILEAAAQVGVAHERAGIAQSTIDIAGDCQLMVAEQIAEDECGSTGERTVVRRIADRWISDVVRVEGDVVRVLLEPTRVRQSV